MGVLRLALLRLSAAMMGVPLLCSGPQAAYAQTSAPLLLLQYDDTDTSEQVQSETFDQSRFDDAYEKYGSDRELQRERPFFEIDLPDDPPKIKSRTSWNLPSWLGGFASGLVQLLKLVFWVAIGLAVLAILYFLFTQLRLTNLRRKKGKSGKDKPEDDHYADIRPDKKTALTLLEEADKLAGTGDYAEAVHLLLFRSIDDIQQRLDGGVPKSLTAREIGQLDAIPERTKSALSPIIQIVERSFFGDAEVTESDWQTARKAYETFAFGEEWS